MNGGHWNPRLHPRDRNTGRFSDSWVGRISDAIEGSLGVLGGLGRDRGDHSRTVDPSDLAAAAPHIRPGMLEYQDPNGDQWHPVHSVGPWGRGGVQVMHGPGGGFQTFSPLRVRPAGVELTKVDAPRVGVPRGDGTYEATPQELVENASRLEGKIEYYPWNDAGTKLLSPRLVRFIQAHNDKGLTLYERSNVTTLLSMDRQDRRPVVIRYVGEPTQDEQFFDLRLASGVESEESVDDLLTHEKRYIDKVEVYDPESGDWGTFQGIEYDEDDSGVEFVRVWVGQVGAETPIDLYQNTVRIRPVGG